MVDVLFGMKEGVIQTPPTRGMSTLGRFIGVRHNFHLNFICRWPCVFTRSENAVTKILLNGIMSTTNATDLVKKMCHIMGLNFLNFIFILLVPCIDLLTQCVDLGCTAESAFIQSDFDFLFDG